jgi:glycosyltransferase involved in cell wall biosynthesis
MDCQENPMRVLYSFPHRIGATRICTTAWHQVEGLAKAGAQVRVFSGSVERPLPLGVEAKSTLVIGGLRIPYRVLGNKQAFWMHDYIVSRHLASLADRVDIIHVWPLGALRTLKVARQLGIPAVLERPNAHTRFAYEVVRQECERLGVQLPSGHEHAYNEHVLRREEAEYELATALLCPSDFVAQTFAERGFAISKLERHQYGFDARLYHPSPTTPRPTNKGLDILFVGGCAPRKGLHYALEAWLASPASAEGRFRIAGAFVPGYAERLASLLLHPSVEVLGHRDDVADLMRDSDILTLPSIEEGSALVTSEARGSGCVLLVSEAAGAICQHMQDALVHAVGDVATLCEHFTILHRDRDLLKRLREESLKSIHNLTWDAAGHRLLEIYSRILRMRRQSLAIQTPTSR